MSLKRGPLARRLTLLGVLAMGLFFAVHLHAGPELRSREWAIDGFRPPPRWDLTPRDRPSYPQLIAWASRGDGSERAVISLVGKRVAAHTTIRDLLPEAQAIKSAPQIENVRIQVLSTLGWTTGWTGNVRIQVDANLPAQGKDRARVVRQYLFLNGPVAYTMTLVAPLEQATARLRDLDDTAANLVPIDPEGVVSTATTNHPDGGLRPDLANPTTK
ncbi:MAG TPA: hypothetical protein PKL17_21485 [Pseudomonadota bacterium]|nr:hypothetical protein [Pseudomonadota bacterium]HNF96476.1 hypothetical protein [Pseudomonadota bacterium]HNI59595.1 hypothetical protein [Pseudomonadota bacterium]HNK47371.1 hypothetical protein [Pseudomonadota bacterium]HNN50403.1 hypothetical protein [Pseudomonadota bacterium]